MSLAPSSEPALADPSYDLDYSIHDFEADSGRDSQFLYKRIEDEMYRHGARVGERTLDIACGVGRIAAGVSERGGEGWGLEPSQEMLGLSRWLFPAERVVLVRGIAEALPFRDGSFDRLICQGSLDHFVKPHEFMGEAARVLRPGGRVIIALANYESLSCRLGRFLYRVATDLLRRPQPPHRPYWQPPPDHFHRGDLPFVRALGKSTLRLESCYGLSLLWLLYYWGSVMDRLPRPLAQGVLQTLDRIAYRAPALSDMIVSVWRSHEQDGAT